MKILRLGRDGRVTIPRAFLRRLGAEPGSILTAEVRDEREIVLRALPVEAYDDERVAEFVEEDRLDPDEARALRAWRSSR